MTAELAVSNSGGARVSNLRVEAKHEDAVWTRALHCGEWFARLELFLWFL